jgi:hypothetical protein
LCDDDRHDWLEVLGAVCERFNWVVHAFCQMTVMGVDLPWLTNASRAKKPRRLPSVLTVGEVKDLLSRLEVRISRQIGHPSPSRPPP